MEFTFLNFLQLCDLPALVLAVSESVQLAVVDVRVVPGEGEQLGQVEGLVQVELQGGGEMPKGPVADVQLLLLHVVYQVR